MSVTAGVDIGGTRVRAALVDERGSLSQQISRATDPRAGTASILAAIEDLLKIANERPVAVGVGIAAYTEYPSGRVAFAPNLQYGDRDVAAALRRRVDVPVVVENDANAAVWGEHLYGAGRGISEMVMVTVGTGIGGGIVAGGRLYRGSRGFAGEFGHMTVVDGGPECACGELGCLEALASGTAIGRMAREEVAAGARSAIVDLAGGHAGAITGEIVSEAASHGDPVAMKVMETAGRYLGIGLANLANLFDPEIIVVGGGGAASGRLLLDPATRELERKLSGRREVPKVVVASLGEDAGIVGAAALARLALQGD